MEDLLPVRCGINTNGEVNDLSLRARKIAEKKEEIIRMAIRVLSEKGYYGITMEEIASKLLMTKGTVYYYFKDKQDLLYQSQMMLLGKSLDNMNSIRQQDLPIMDKLKKAMTTHIEYLLTEKSGFESMLKPEQIFSKEQLEVILKRRDEYGKCFDQLIAEGIKANTFYPVDIKVVRNIILGAMNWVIQWYSDSGKKSKTEIAEDITEYLLRILIKTGGD